MDKKESVKISLPLFITIIVLLVAIISGTYVYMQNQKLDKEILKLRDDINQSQTAKNELQAKLDDITNVASNTENDVKEEVQTSENQFNLYQENFEKTYKSIVAKYEGQAGNEGKIKIEQIANIPSRGSVTVRSNGDAYFGTSSNNFDTDKKIDTNVASVHYCSVGQDSGDIVLIHRDGTVSIIKDAIYPDTKIETKKVEKAKNIVSVISVFEYDEMDGGNTYYLVDINGNIIDIR